MDTSAITLDALHAHRVFAERLNFTRAAEELHISQPALHVKITKLGAALGVTLYERDGRSLVLTAAGASVARFAQRHEQELRDFVDELTTPATEPLVLAAGEGAHLYVLAGAVRRLLGDGADLRLLTTDAARTIDAVRSGDADVGVTVVDGRPKGLVVTTIATYPQVVVVPTGHPIARRRSVRLADLAGTELVVAPPGRPHRKGIDRALRRAGVEWSVAIETEGWAPMLHFASLGIGLALVNGCVTPGPGLVSRPVDDLAPITYSAVHRRTDASAERIIDVVDLVRASAP